MCNSNLNFSRKRVFELCGDVVAVKDGVITLNTPEVSPVDESRRTDRFHMVYGASKALLAEAKKATKMLVMGWIDTQADGKLMADSKRSKAVGSEMGTLNNAIAVAPAWKKFQYFPARAGKRTFGNLVLEYSKPDGSPDGLFNGTVLNPADCARFNKEIKRGDLVKITGALRSRSFVDGNGNARTRIEMIVEDGEVLMPAITESNLDDTYNPEPDSQEIQAAPESEAQVDEPAF